MKHRGILDASRLALTAFLTACSMPAASIYPLVPDDELTLDPVLLGHWLEEDSDLLYTVTESEKSGWYAAEFISDDCESLQFRLAIANVNDEQFLVLTSIDYQVLFTLPTYTFVRAQISTDVLELTILDDTWFTNHIEANPEAISHLLRPNADDENEILLSATPKELQAFFLKHRETDGAYEEFTRHDRLSEAAARELEASWECDESLPPDD